MAGSIAVFPFDIVLLGKPEGPVWYTYCTNLYYTLYIYIYCYIILWSTHWILLVVEWSDPSINQPVGTGYPPSIVSSDLGHPSIIHPFVDPQIYHNISQHSMLFCHVLSIPSHPIPSHPTHHPQLNPIPQSESEPLSLKKSEPPGLTRKTPPPWWTIWKRWTFSAWWSPWRPGVAGGASGDNMILICKYRIIYISWSLFSLVFRRFFLEFYNVYLKILWNFNGI